MPGPPPAGASRQAVRFACRGWGFGGRSRSWSRSARGAAPGRGRPSAVCKLSPEQAQELVGANAGADLLEAQPAWCTPDLIRQPGELLPNEWPVEPAPRGSVRRTDGRDGRAGFTLLRHRILRSQSQRNVIIEGATEPKVRQSPALDVLGSKGTYCRPAARRPSKAIVACSGLLRCGVVERWCP
jgi:hypothetical protein